MSRVLGVIPARYSSTRFPGKPLAPLADGTLLEQVWRRAVQSTRLESVIVATDDRRIADAAESCGAETMMTSADHPSGTDRAAEVCRRLEAAGRTCDVVINIQGDEPLITPTSLDLLAAAFDGDRTPPVEMATLAEPIESAADLFDPNTVKVVAAGDGRALYFSRSPVPYRRAEKGTLAADFRPLLEKLGDQALHGYRKHQGIYAYTRETLLALTRSGPSPLETAEGLEQLRALEAGYSILVIDSDFRSIGVDTPADLEKVESLLGARLTRPGGER